MRKTLSAAALAVAVGAAVLPLSSASAVCVTVYQQVTGRCSPCNDVGAAYHNVDNRAGDALPDHLFDCLA